MRRIISLSLALTLFGTAVSCADSGDSSSTVIEAESLSFKEAHIAMGDDFLRILSLDRSGNKVLIFGESKSGGYIAYITDDSFKEHTTIEFTPKDGEEVRSACIDRLGRVTILTTLDGDTLLYIYGSIGTLSSEENLGEVVPESDYSAMIYSAYEGYVINHGNMSLSVIDGDLNYIGEADVGSRMVYGFCIDSDGIPTVLLNDGKNTELAKLDGTSLTDIRQCGDRETSAFSLCTGNSEYELVGSFMDGLYGFDGENWVRITDYSTNTFSPYEILGLLTVGDEFAVVNGTKLTMLSEREISEIKPRKSVTMATFSVDHGPCTDLIKQFNAQNEDYRIDLVSYAYDGDRTAYEQKMKELRLDIVSGNAPDLIVDFIPGLDRSEYYLDLSGYLSSDPELNSADFIPEVLEGMTYKGKIPVIFPTFMLSTLVAKTKHVGEKENVGYGEFLDICSSVPDGMNLFEYQEILTMDSVLLSMMNETEFLDYENGECHFDSPDFIRLMSFVKDNRLGMTQREFDSWAEQNRSLVWERSFGLRDDTVLFGSNIISPADTVRLFHAEIGEPVTFVGYPSSNGKGGGISPAQNRFSIMRNAKEPDGAWEFIKFAFMSDDAKNGGFSVLEERFKEQMDYTMHVTHIDENGVEQSGGRWSYHLDGSNGKWEYIDYDSFTQEEADRLESYVRKSATELHWIEEDAHAIIVDELTDYFNTDRSAEQASEILQNRMSTYMSENYG